MRAFLKFIKYTLLIFLAIIVLSASLTYIFQDKIIELTFKEINKHLATKIEIDRNVNLSIIEKFPEISIRVKNVNIYDSYPGSQEKLAQLKTLYFTFDAYDFIKGKYVLKNIYAESGEISIKINEQGLGNYFITKKDTTSTSNISFDLQKIVLEDVIISYSNIPVNQNHKIHAINLISSLKLVEKSWFIGLKGDAKIYHVGIGGNEYFKDKDIKIQSNQEYHQEGGVFKILPSEVMIEGSAFKLTGLYEGSEKFIELSLKAEKATITNLLSLLPGKLSRDLRSYKSSGNIFFDAHIKGKITANDRPAVNVDFGFSNASFEHPEFNKRITGATLLGNFSNGPSHDLSTARLNLTNIHALLENRAIEGNFSLINFEDPFLKFDLKGIIDLQSFIHFVPANNIASANGLLDLNILFEGKIAHLKNKEDLTKIKREGSIRMDSVNFKLTNNPLIFSDFNGAFDFNNSDINIQSLSGNVGKSNFTINGSLKNLLYKLITNKGAITIDGDIKSGNLNLDELQNAFSNSKKSNDTASSTQLSDYKVRLNYKIDAMNFRRLFTKDLSGTFEWNNEIATLKNLKLKTAGGDVASNTTINLQSKNSIGVSTNTNITNINIDSILYICDNFNQDFIQDKNIKGQFTGQLNCSFTMSKNLDIKTETVVATIDATIKNGELNNFEPMKKLARFINEKELENIRFSELKNKLIIENNKITIPEMEIKSSISNISVMGTHSFNQEMDYKLAVPIKDFKKKHPDNDAAFGAIEEDNKGHSKLFLTIKGTTDNYKIAYDTKRTGKKIKEDLKKEKKELEDLFKKRKTEQIVTPTPSETEFFDF